MPGETPAGRFSVEFAVANNRDVLNLPMRERALDRIKHVVLSGVVDSGAGRLVLPQRAVDELQLEIEGEAMVRYADHRREKRPLVSNVYPREPDSILTEIE